MGQSVSIPNVTGVQPPQIVKPTPSDLQKPKPCCVCKEEKATRDECMLFSTSQDPHRDCAPVIEKYKSCMAGFGFELP